MSIRLTVYPDECDAFGHLNQASYLALFERARWELLARGPGMDVFDRAGVWPAVRRAVVDYHAGAWPGDVLEFSTELVARSRSTFTLRQRAVRVGDGKLCATLETVFVCINRSQLPVAVPDEVIAAIAAEPRRIEVAEGRTLAWDEAGSTESGHTVLLIHGYPLDRKLWSAQLEGVSGHRLLAPDLRGTGGSGDAPAPESLAEHADDMIALLDALKVDRAVVVGLSMGGYVALDMAARHRDRLAGLVLIDSRAAADTAEGRAARDSAIATVEAEGVVPVVRAMAMKLFGSAVPEGVRESILARMRETTPATMIATLRAMRDRPDRTELLSTLVGLPTLVIVGAEDQITPPAVSRSMVEAIPSAELVEVEGAGHLPPVESPGTVNEALQTFLDRLDREV